MKTRKCKACGVELAPSIRIISIMVLGFFLSLLGLYLMSDGFHLIMHMQGFLFLCVGFFVLFAVRGSMRSFCDDCIKARDDVIEEIKNNNIEKRKDYFRRKN